MEQQIDPNGQNLVTTWNYLGADSIVSDWTGFGQLVSLQRYDGYFENHNYSVGSHVVERPQGTGTSVETRQWTAHPTNGGGTLATNTVQAGTPTVTISKREDIYDSTATTHTAKVYRDATHYLQTKTTYVDPGSSGLGGEISGIDHPDGTSTTFQYGSAFNNEHRTTATTTTAKAYSCCGLLSETDRHGNRTLYAYDVLGRRIKSNTLGITTATAYNGPTVSQYRYPETPAGDILAATPANEISRTIRNLAGDVIASWGPSPQSGALEQLTTYETTYRNPAATPPNPDNLAAGIGKRVAETAMLRDAATAQQTTSYLCDGRTCESTGALAPDIDRTSPRMITFQPVRWCRNGGISGGPPHSINRRSDKRSCASDIGHRWGR